MTHDHVLLEAVKGVHLAQSRGIGKNSGRFLERSRGDETFRFDRGLRNSQKDRLRLGWFTTCLNDSVVLAEEG